MGTKAISKLPSMKEKIIYGLGDVGLNAAYTLFSSYILYFYTDVVGMNAALIGTVILISKILDGISDVIAGYLIDTHSGKGGHCIPVLFKWSVPFVLCGTLTFLVPDASIPVRLFFIFVTYNLFNTVMYTYVSIAHSSLATYATSDTTARSQMTIYKMLFAAAAQMVMANLILPMVNYFGGEKSQAAWVKTSLVFSLVGLAMLMLNVFVVKERVELQEKPESFLKNIGLLFKNKYWIMNVFLCIICNTIMTFNLSIAVYYLKSVVNNMNLMGIWVTMCNLPAVIMMIVLPQFVAKVSKRNLFLFGTTISLAAQLVFCFAPSGNVAILLGTAAVKGFGFAFMMGLLGAMLADTIEYGEWRTGKRIQGVLLSAQSLGGKVGSGVITAVFSMVLTAVGYVGTLEVQTASTISGIDLFFKWGLVAVYVITIVILLFWNLDKEYPTILKELEERRKS